MLKFPQFFDMKRSEIVIGSGMEAGRDGALRRPRMLQMSFCPKYRPGYAMDNQRLTTVGHEWTRMDTNVRERRSLPQIALKRGIYAASSFASPSANCFPHLSQRHPLRPTIDYIRSCNPARV
jgi:hypothetical protein